MHNRLLTLLRIGKPIIQAPMAGVSTPAMAAAVSSAGGLGSLGLGASTVSEARAQIRETRDLTDRPFNVNLFCHAPARLDAAREVQWLNWLAPEFHRLNAHPPGRLREIYTSFSVNPEMLAMLIQERVPVVSFHFGLPPAPFIAALQRAGTILLATATNLREAVASIDAGVNAIVAQGMEAGGHRGRFEETLEDEFLGTMELTRMLVDRCRTPIIAAGGIMDGNGIAAALALGAQAAQLGTAFVACPESAIDEGYRRAFLSPTARTTFLTAISGRRARCLVNDFARLDVDPDRPSTPDYPLAYDAGKALHAAAQRRGVQGFGAHWAGQGVRLARSPPAAALVLTLSLEANASGSESATPFSVDGNVDG